MGLFYRDRQNQANTGNEPFTASGPRALQHARTQPPQVILDSSMSPVANFCRWPWELPTLSCAASA